MLWLSCSYLSEAEGLVTQFPLHVIVEQLLGVTCLLSARSAIRVMRVKVTPTISVRSEVKVMHKLVTVTHFLLFPEYQTGNQ